MFKTVDAKIMKSRRAVLAEGILARRNESAGIQSRIAILVAESRQLAKDHGMFSVPVKEKVKETDELYAREARIARQIDRIGDRIKN